MALIVAEDLAKSYSKVIAVNGLNLTLNEGTVTGRIHIGFTFAHQRLESNDKALRVTLDALASRETETLKPFFAHETIVGG